VNASTVAGPLLELRGLSCSHRQGRGQPPVRALDRVDLALAPGEILGLAGESGSGKSTLARVVLGLLRPDAGSVLLGGQKLGEAASRRRSGASRRIQIVFQDPGSALSPRRTVLETLREPLQLFDIAPRREWEAVAGRALAEVGLGTEALHRYPHEFSSGQRQRIAIARALISDPEVLVADEAVSALDVSVQAQVLDLLERLRRERGIAMLFISHDLEVLRQLADRLAVMYRGRIVEQAPTNRLFQAPAHPYARDLLASAPRLAGETSPAEKPAEFSGNDGGSLLSRVSRPATGCPYRSRCRRARPRCEAEAPLLAPLEGRLAHAVECFFPAAE
jgi:peptide/nickel transport system ATP-binding protein